MKMRIFIFRIVLPNSKFSQWGIFSDCTMREKCIYKMSTEYSTLSALSEE
jgi:hypothetical protein